jgi:hypothetical protein
VEEVFPQDREEECFDSVHFENDQDFTESDCKLELSVELGVLMVQNFKAFG